MRLLAIILLIGCSSTGHRDVPAVTVGVSLPRDIDLDNQRTSERSFDGELGLGTFMAVTWLPSDAYAGPRGTSPVAGYVDPTEHEPHDGTVDRVVDSLLEDPFRAWLLLPAAAAFALAWWAWKGFPGIRRKAKLDPPHEET